MDLRDLIEREIEQHLEWPTADKSHVTTVSAKLLAEHVARLYADHIPDAEKCPLTNRLTDKLEKSETRYTIWGANIKTMKSCQNAFLV